MATSRHLGFSAIVALTLLGAGVGIGAPVSGAQTPSCRGRAATIVGSAGPDRLTGTSRSDVIVGRAGADDIEGHGGGDLVCGDRGKDHLAGNHGSDGLYGGRGRDRVRGGRGIDRCRAEATFTCSAAAVWRMSETSGTTMTDSSGNSNDGTTFHVRMGGRRGFMFEPSARSKVVVPRSSTLNPGDRAFSYGARVRSDDAPPSGTDYDLLRKGIGSTEGGEYKLEIVNAHGEGRAFCLVKDSQGTGATVRGTTDVMDGKAHTLTCTKTASGLALRVDAHAPRTESVPSGLGAIGNRSPLVIGAKTPTVKGPAGDWYNGAMLQARIRVRATAP